MELNVSHLQWEKMSGLLPAIVQSSLDGTVLMLGYMNQEALLETQKTRMVVLYSRSKERLWKKGEESGHVLVVDELFADCDGDTLLIKARPVGSTCHNGSVSCFGSSRSWTFIPFLESIINDRCHEGGEESYVFRLNQSGVEAIAKKIGEEGVETSLALMDGDEQRIQEEAADLVFHLLVGLHRFQLSFTHVIDILQKRHQKHS